MKLMVLMIRAVRIPLLTTSVLCLIGCDQGARTQTETQNQTQTPTQTQAQAASETGPTGVDTNPPTSVSAASPLSVEDVDAEAAAKLIAEDPGIVVIDVRTPAEFATGHIAGATNIDFNAPGFRDALSGLDRNKRYLVHCAAGGRSTRCLPDFAALGFKSIVHLKTGFNDWRDSGKPVEP